MRAIADSSHMARRHVMELVRQPWWILVNLVQPVIWLLLFGALFETITDVPGFGSDNYIEFLAPGVVMMTAFFAAGWSGMPMLEDLERGVTDRLLVSPVTRASLIVGRLVQSALMVVIQTLIIVALAVATGAEFANGLAGIAVVVALAVMIGSAFGALANGLALHTRREETLIALMQFLMLPLAFMSVVFMQEDLMPGWMRSIVDFNPLNWAVEGAREALTSDPDWGLVAADAALLAALMAVSTAFAVRALGAYQRSL
jgi:ABC-2 type transport system permease protein